MNLTTEPWIPAVRRGGSPATLTLREAFGQGADIEDLAVRPHERIALMRLLICVAQAALDGPDDLDEWAICKPRIAPAAIDYLERWKSSFELFGAGQRFLQVANLRKSGSKRKSTAVEANGEGTLVSKLDLALASGNNATLFDNAGGSTRALTPGAIALALLTYQCFSPCGKIGVALWDGAPTAGGGSSDNAPCLAGGMLHALLRGENLLDTIHRNLMTRRQVEEFYDQGRWGRPVWELMPKGPSDQQAVGNASETYLGRLVPLARAVWLGEDRVSLVLANGLKYAPFPAWRESAATIVIREVKGRPTRLVLRAEADKAPWRELHALMVKAASQGSDGIGGPAALQNLSDAEAFDLWVGGLVASKAKPIDTAESVFHQIPAAMLGEVSQRIYESGVREAEQWSFRARRAVSAYHREIGDGLDRPEMRKRRLQIQSKACTQFWTDVEVAVPHLLEAVSSPECLGVKVEWKKTAWGLSIRRAARDAYESACPHETPRQIRAWALGLGELLATAGPPSKDGAETEVEE